MATASPNKSTTKKAHVFHTIHPPSTKPTFEFLRALDLSLRLRVLLFWAIICFFNGAKSQSPSRAGLRQVVLTSLGSFLLKASLLPPAPPNFSHPRQPTVGRPSPAANCHHQGRRSYHGTTILLLVNEAVDMLLAHPLPRQRPLSITSCHTRRTPLRRQSSRQ